MWRTGYNTTTRIIYVIYLFTAIGLLPGGSDYFTCKQNINLVTARFKLGGLHEKLVFLYITNDRLTKQCSMKIFA